MAFISALVFNPAAFAVDQLPLFETKIVCQTKGTKILKKTVGVKGDGKKETARFTEMSILPVDPSDFSIYITGTKGGGTLSTIFSLYATMGDTPDFATMTSGEWFDFTAINPQLHISKDRVTFPITYPVVDNDIVTDTNLGSTATGKMRITDYGFDPDEKLLASGALVVTIHNVLATRSIENESGKPKNQSKTLRKVIAKCTFKNLYLKN